MTGFAVAAFVLSVLAISISVGTLWALWWVLFGGGSER